MHATPSVAPQRRRYRAPRVLVVASSMGAGHVSAARALERQASTRGATVHTVDFLALAPWRQGELVRAFYRAMVSGTPAVYDQIMRLWAHHPEMFERLTSAGEAGYRRSLQAEVDAFGPDVIVSTYNLAGQMLGRLRAAGVLDVPVVAYVTDPGAHPYWVARGADVHLAPLAVTARTLHELGARQVRVVRPLVETPPARLPRDHARRRFGLPVRPTVALINGGSWGVGDPACAAQAVSGDNVVTVVLCGRSKRLRDKVRGIANCRPVGWTNQVAALIDAADVVVDNAGGATCWEALVAARPVVLHRPLAGHGRLNAAALAQAGLVTVTTTRAQLREAVCCQRHPPPPAGVLDADDAVDVVLSTAS